MTNVCGFQSRSRKVMMKTSRKQRDTTSLRHSTNDGIHQTTKLQVSTQPWFEWNAVCDLIAGRGGTESDLLPATSRRRYCSVDGCALYDPLLEPDTSWLPPDETLLRALEVVARTRCESFIGALRKHGQLLFIS